MRRSRWTFLAALAAIAGAAEAQRATDLQISEVLADNVAGRLDDNGFAADWIELFNPLDREVSLQGYQLVDDENRPFVLPDLRLEAKGYLVVYASGKSRAQLTRPFHTGFRLSRRGETLRLLAPSGDEVSRLTYGRQTSDVSTGFAQSFKVDELLSPLATSRFLVPEDELPEDWQQPEFDDSRWTEAVGGCGFDIDEPSSMRHLIATDVAKPLRGNASTICYRLPFFAPPIDQVGQLLLELRSASGHVVWLNGREILRWRLEGEPTHESSATVQYEDRDPLRALQIDLTPHRDILRANGNVLAVQSLLEHKFVPRHLMTARIANYRAASDLGDELQLFLEPTPGRANGDGVTRIPRLPRIRPFGGVFREPVDVAIDSKDDGVELRYTLDGTVPTKRSPVCPSTLKIEATSELRVRGFLGDVAGKVSSAQFTQQLDDAATFDSNLPLLVVTTGAREVPIKVYTDAFVQMHDVGESGRSSLGSEPSVVSRGAIKLRGSSTLPLAKKGYGIELRDRSGEDRARKLLDMPAASDWVLYAPHHWDQSHLRNALCYELARRMGLQGPRCRFVELFVCDDGQPLSRDHYRGLYLLVERIQVGKNRLAIDELKPAHVAEPEITGGYVFKADRLGSGEYGFKIGKQSLQFVEPSEKEITDPQRGWLRRHLAAFDKGLVDGAFADPERGYAAFLDVDNAVDYHLFQEFTNNPDAYTLSTYFYKPRGERIQVGPVWDFDRTFRTNDAEYWLGRASNPFGWTNDYLARWWGYLFKDEQWRLRYRTRGRAWLRGELSIENVHALVDELAALIAEAEQRDRARWPVLRPGEWENEIIRLKEYITKRSRWMLAEVLEQPVYERIGEGLPFELRITQGNERGTLYYTTDGSDPMLRSLEVSPRARVYEGPLTFDEDVRVQARVLVDGLWSRRTDYWHVQHLPKVAITEVMYNPPGGRDYEFIELRNYGDAPIDLHTLRLDGQVNFAFRMGSMRWLQPGAFVLVVQDLPKFQKRYDISKLPIAGAYYGNCNNTEGVIRVIGSADVEVASAHYNDDWLPPTDGKGFSMMAKAAKPAQRSKEDWQRSPAKGGSPGR